MRFKEPLLLVALSALLLLPFVNRALFVDDHAHVEVARELMTHPLKPYHFDARGMGWEKGESPLNANPLAYFYLIGFFMEWAGEEEWKSHLFMLVFNWAALLAFYAIAKRYVRRPLWAAALWLTTPHFWLTANSLLLDAMIAPFMLTGLTLWISGWEKHSWTRLSGSGLCLGLAALVKYTAVLSWPLVVVWTLLEAREKKSPKWLALAIPFLMFGLWMLWTRNPADTSHVTAVARESMAFPSGLRLFLLPVFTAGTSTLLLISYIWLFLPAFRDRRPIGFLILAGAMTTGLLFGFPLSVGLQLGFWAGGFLLWLYTLIPQKDDVSRGWIFLIFWVGLTLTGLLFARDWYCGRYFVIAGPALILLTILTMEKRLPHLVEKKWFRLAVFLPTLVSSGLLATADYLQASVNRNAAKTLNTWAETEGAPSGQYYPAAMLSGLGSYLNPNFWQGIEPQARVPNGAAVVLPRRTLAPVFFPVIENAGLIQRWVHTIPIPLRTLDSASFAGFYGSIWGPLPFSISTAPAEIFILVRSGAGSQESAERSPD